MAMLNVSKFDHISKNLIRSGSPTLYQLNMKKEKTGGVTKLTFGEKDLKKPVRTILLVGETGTGKSTLINALTNYAMGVKWEDDVWFKIVDEEEKKAQSESQTSDVIVYEIFGFEGETLPYSLTIIDTPGYGSTTGTGNDDIVSKRLHDLFRSENGVHEINVVALVMKETENRLTDRSRYIFDSMVSLFGNDMEKNIISVFTHSAGRKPKDALGAIKAANIKCAKDEKMEPVHFLFSNSQKEDRTEDEDTTEILKQEEQRATKAIKKFSQFLEKADPRYLKKTVEVLDSRIRLTACIQNLQERVEEIELKQKEVQQTQDALKKHKEEIKSNKNFTVEVDEVYKDTEPIKGGWWFFDLFSDGATCCTVCEENCHRRCTWARSPESCKVMVRGRCTVCTGRCPVSAHVKEQWTYISKTRKVQKTLQDVKDRYEIGKKSDQGDIVDVKDEHEKGEADCESVLESLKKEMKQLEKNKDQWLEDAFDHVVKLEQIALNADSLSTHVHLDFLIEGMKEKGDTEKVEKLEEIKNRLGEDAGKGLRYKQTTAGKMPKKH